MTTPQRTPTPDTNDTWNHTNTLNRWHQLWIHHLQTQNTPTQTTHAYLTAANEHLDNPDTWRDEVTRVEATTRHDLTAALTVFNAEAGHDQAHNGLTSHDITDVTTQTQILDSLHNLIASTRPLRTRLANQAELFATHPILARTHGQPAQTTTIGHRIATILEPLNDWHDRAQRTAQSYPMRPPHGAVGTAADLARILGIPDRRRSPAEAQREVQDLLTAHGYDQQAVAEVLAANAHLLTQDTASRETTWDQIHAYSEAIREALGFERTMWATRQTYHRSYDLPIAGLIVEYCSIARTWATDRRLEAILGLGNENRDPGQTGSSIMAHKTNPVLCERIYALTGQAAGYYQMVATHAADGWLEGDVSTSAARREIWPAIFRLAESITTNWLDAIDRWQWNFDAIADELDEHWAERNSTAIIYWLQQLPGMSRAEAYGIVRDAITPGSTRLQVMGRIGDQIGLDHIKRLENWLGDQPTFPPHLAEQIKQVSERARLT